MIPLTMRAGIVSLTADEALKLRALLTKNEAAAKQFAGIQTAADTALGEQPHPIEKVISEGHLLTDPAKIRTIASLKDMQKIESLGWAWAATNDLRYSEKARAFILAWARVNQPDGNAINETKFEPLVSAYDLLRSAFTKPEQSLVDHWLREKAETLIKVEKGNDGNWFSHKLKMVGLVGLTLGDDMLTTWAIDGFRKQIAANFDPDGASHDFHKRDALHYHLYAVEPLLTLAIACERRGEPLFDYRAPNGASLHAAVDFVVPFAEGRKTQMEFANSKVAFDHVRAANGEEEYQPHPWDPRAAIDLLSEAAWFRPEYHDSAVKVMGEPSAAILNWRMVLNAITRPQ